MKAIKLNIKSWSFLAAFLMVFTFAACDDDDNKGGNFNTASIETLITEAETLIETTEEGINAGDQKPGSKAELQSVIDWVRWKMENADSQDDISDAAVKLQRYIDIFKANIVAVAMPWIQQENETWIQISDNIKPIFKESFTIETQIYVVDLNQKGYSNNIFATEQDGPDSGFVIRYFNDGVIHLNVGTADGWRDVKTDPGVMKSGEWMQIAFVNEITSQKLYVNGVEVLSQTQTYLPGADKSFVIGNGPTWTDRVVNAVVKDVRVWKGARTDSEIADNKTATLTGTEANLEMFLPLSADLGSEFKDVTGNYIAKFQGKVEWVSEPPVIVLNYIVIDEAISAAEAFLANVVESDQVGDYPIGTKSYLQEVIDEVKNTRENGSRQADLDEQAEKLSEIVEIVAEMTVADADGIYFNPDEAADFSPNTIGFEIKNNYRPDGDYTIELMVKVKSFALYEKGIIFSNHRLGLSYDGYEDTSEEEIFGAGGLFNFTNGSDKEEGLRTNPLVLQRDKWHHIAIVHNEATQTSILYLDGVAKVTKTEVGLPDGGWWGELWLGNSWFEKPMNGYLKNFRIWNAVKSDSELNADITGNEDNLIMYFPMDRVAGKKYYDVTGNYTGELKGVLWNVIEE